MNQRNINSTVKKASIHLRSVIDGEETHYDYIGEYRLKDGSHCISYNDYMGNAITKVGIEAREDAMLLHRVGFITADMLFDPSTDTIVNYDAVSLRNGFVLHTDKYHIAQKDGAFMIDAEYTLNDGSGESVIIGIQEIKITFLEDENA